jgi:quinol monooxygenase YgiN
MTITRGLLVRLEAKPGKEEDVAAFLRDALGPVQGEPGTVAWFAVRFGPSSFAIFDVFPDDTARQAHLNGPIGKALAERADELFSRAPSVEPVEVMADKVPH